MKTIAEDAATVHTRLAAHEGTMFGDLIKALGVLILDPKTRAYLVENDPKALEQARRALRLDA